MVVGVDGVCGGCCYDGGGGVRMRQLNTIQALTVSLPVSALLYMVAYQFFVVLGDVLRWAL